MLSSGVTDCPEVFFDSVDSFSSRDFIASDLASPTPAVGFWRNEFNSVQERRQVFFQQMGFFDDDDDSVHNTSSLQIEVERIRESSEASSSSSSSSTSSSDESASSVVTTTPTTTDFCEREENTNANSMLDDKSKIKHSIKQTTKLNSNRNKMMHWLTKMSTSTRVINAFRSTTKTYKHRQQTETKKVQVNKKRVKELTAVYTGQEFQAHNGAIWTAKLSPDGKYLATGGQDGLVRVWQISSTTDDSCFLTEHGNSSSSSGRRTNNKKLQHVPVMIPDTVFRIHESPLHEFRGHSADVVDLDWSTSNCLLSSSVDNTVRLWQVGSSDCVKVFQHPDFVTCVQFNPVDDGHFVSGSVDGKIRVWGVSEGRVKDWDDIRDSVTSVSYQPNGQGLAVGSVNGVCRFYESSGGSVQLISQTQVGTSKRSSGNRITGIQFLPDDNEKVMVTSENSKIRIMDKSNIIHKYRGLSGSGCQMSASFTRNQRHIVSIGEDSRVYLWDYNNTTTNTTTTTTTPESASFTPPARHSNTSTKPVRSCESFHSKGVSVAVPWSSSSNTNLSHRSCLQQKCHCMSSTSSVVDSSLPLPCLSNLFPLREGSVRVSPEELLSQDQSSGYCCGSGGCSPAWGLVIVTGSLDGTIRAFHNYGLPVRV